MEGRQAGRMDGRKEGRKDKMVPFLNGSKKGTRTNKGGGTMEGRCRKKRRKEGKGKESIATYQRRTNSDRGNKKTKEGAYPRSKSPFK